MLAVHDDVVMAKAADACRGVGVENDEQPGDADDGVDARVAPQLVAGPPFHPGPAPDHGRAVPRWRRVVARRTTPPVRRVAGRTPRGSTPGRAHRVRPAGVGHHPAGVSALRASALAASARL